MSNGASGGNGRGAADPGELKEIVHQMSMAAFDMAKEFCSAPGEDAHREKQARQLNSYLDELVPYIQSAPPDDRAELQSAWTDARMDIGYVLSRGELPMSLRLNQYRQGLTELEE